MTWLPAPKIVRTLSPSHSGAVERPGGDQGQPVPEELEPKIGKAFSELFDRVDGIFTEYELEGPRAVSLR